MSEALAVREVDDSVSCADALVASITEERRVVADRFARVAEWADFHCPESDPAFAAEPLRGGARGRAELGWVDVGAEGTPVVTRAGIVELGMLLQTSTGSAQALLRDVLELRHRLPAHWAAVQGLEVEGWKARQVATLTRRLTLDQARMVDTQVLDAVVGLPWGRAKDVIEGRVIAADQEAHTARLAEEENRRFVFTRRRSNAVGLRTMIARGHAGDIARLEAMVGHVADRFAIAGDTRPLDFRRADALAMLANPARTCLFLATHTDNQANQANQANPEHPVSGPPGADGNTDDRAEERAVGGFRPSQEQLFGTDEPDPEVASAPSAVELAVAFGRVLTDLGAAALDRLRPRAVLYLHLSAEAVHGTPGCGVVRVEDPVAGGPVSIHQLRTWLRNHRITVKPVLDPTGAEPVDGYEIPTHLREAVRLLHPFETFPWGTTATGEADLDHPDPYVPPDKGGPPGQTALTNLGPLGRRHHLAKTFDGFTVHQIDLGTYLWRSPTGHCYQVDYRGTHYLGRHAGDARPAGRDDAARLADTKLSPMESRFRERILRHNAA